MGDAPESSTRAPVEDALPASNTPSDSEDESHPQKVPVEAQDVDDLSIYLDPAAEDVDLTHARISKIEHFEPLTALKTLCLRQNALRKLEGLSRNLLLEELDVYDNFISKIENISHLSRLECLDLSFNAVHRIENIAELTHLKRLFFVSNKISKIENLDTNTRLTMLELGSNRIRRIENLGHLSELESLFLGKNKIEAVENLAGLSRLSLLSLQSNRITRLSREIGQLAALTEIYLGHNALGDISALADCVSLEIIDVAANRIEHIPCLHALTRLRDFWANNNLVADFRELSNLPAAAGILETVYFEHNPIQKDPQYRRKLRLALPSLVQIDATLCK